MYLVVRRSRSGRVEQVHNSGLMGKDAAYTLAYRLAQVSMGDSYEVWNLEDSKVEINYPYRRLAGY